MPLQCVFQCHLKAFCIVIVNGLLLFVGIVCWCRVWITGVIDCNYSFYQKPGLIVILSRLSNRLILKCFTYKFQTAEPKHFPNQADSAVVTPGVSRSRRRQHLTPWEHRWLMSHTSRLKEIATKSTPRNGSIKSSIPWSKLGPTSNCCPFIWIPPRKRSGTPSVDDFWPKQKKKRTAITGAHTFRQTPQVSLLVCFSRQFFFVNAPDKTKSPTAT